MKKLISIAAALFFYISKISALPVANPSAATLFFSNTPSKIVECAQNCLCFGELNLSIGYYGDYVFNRNLETVAGKHIDYSRITTNAGYLALNYEELLQVFAALGASKLSLNTSLVAFNVNNRSPRFDFETESALSWSLGAHVTLLKYKCFCFGIMGQYFTTKPRANVWFIRANISARPNDRSRYSEWQVGGGISYHYNHYFIPYIAIKWSRALWEFNNQSLFLPAGGSPVATLINLQSSKKLGCAIGVSFAPFACKNLAITVEGRFGDEAAVHVNGGFSF